MKKGTLKKEGKQWKIASPEFKIPMPIYGEFGLTSELIDKEIEFDNTGGSVKSIRIQGKNYTKIPNVIAEKSITENANRFSKGNNIVRDNNLIGNNPNINNPMRKPARAPYNFISLNNNIISSNGNQDHSCYSSLSGQIEIDVKVVQPLFIRGSDGLFARIDGIPYIPGSSIRGMIKNLVKIVSYGKFDQFTEKTLYRRSSRTDGNDVKAGFMSFSNGEYKIADAGIPSRPPISKSPFSYQFGQDTNSCIFATGEIMGAPKVWKFIKASNSQINLCKQTIEGYESDNNRSEEAIDILKSLKKGKIVDFNENLIGDVTIPSILGIPVFYRQVDGKVISFGHAKYHRIPYSLTIGDHIIQDKISELDFTESIFGTLNQSSKAFFEDVKAVGQVNMELKTALNPKILSSPKPTTYQHYLMQQPDGIQTSQGNLKTWSHKNVPIRGYKNYWHRQTSSDKHDENTWIEIDKVSKSNPEPINPVSPGTVFNGTIRFDNLTSEELGALLFVIDLPESCCHKLGMGKPLGLGSVKISITNLTLINRKERYKSLFDNISDWYKGEENKLNELNEYKNSFSKYICDRLSEASYDDKIGYESLWKVDRLNNLKTILTLTHDMEGAEVNWIDRTRYMEIEREQYIDEPNEYKKRPVLPTPSEVVNKDTYTEK